MGSGIGARRRLGRFGPEISRVGFGAWAAGGAGWVFSLGHQDDASSIAAIHRAVAAGVNWIDTAAVYGCGHSEEVVGRALRQLPPSERPLVFTKCGLQCQSDPHRTPRRDLRPSSIRAELEDSLRRLGQDHIDLYQFHWPDRGGIPIEESWGEMSRLIAAGKVRFGGLSNFSVEEATRAAAIRPVDSLQPPFSLIERGAGWELLPWAESQVCGVIVYSPMQSGLLSGAHDRAGRSRLGVDDLRRRDRHHMEPDYSRNLALVDALLPIARGLDTSLAKLAVAWTLAWPGVTAAIVGARSPDQVDGWVEAPELVLDEAVMEQIARAVSESGSGEGPLLPPGRAA
ncbi:MAG: aldo/keto reductase [Candidatus Dormibacteraceae bacterium]